MVDALFSDRTASRLALVAPAALLAAGAWLLWQLVRMTWLLLAGPTLPPAASPPLPAAPLVTQGVQAAVEISKWHLFGEAGARIDLARLAQQAPATSLKLTLRGTFNEDAAEGGYAIISDEADVHRRYQAGDALPGDAQLIGIYSGRVLLRRAGVDESLSLPNSQPLADSSEQPSFGAGSGAAGVPSATRPQAAASTAAVQPAFINPAISVGMPSMESIRAATGTDIAELARQVSVLPVLENNRMVGVRLSVGRDSDLLVRAGLNPTDIITAVNGIPLDGPERMGELTTALRDTRQVTLSVRRDGSTLQIPVGL